MGIEYGFDLETGDKTGFGVEFEVEAGTGAEVEAVVVIKTVSELEFAHKFGAD